MTRDDVWLDALPVAVIDTQPAPGKASSSGKTTTINYIIADHLNTPRVLTDAQGKPVWRWPWQGNPFGEHKPESLDSHNLKMLDLRNKTRAAGIRLPGSTGRHQDQPRTHQVAQTPREQ